MKVFDNLKQKYRLAKMPVTFADEDIKLLAVMQETSGHGIKMKSGGLFKYSYYVPIDESNLRFARDLFAKNGIYMKVYLEKHHFLGGKRILRTRDINSKKGRDIINFVDKIRDTQIKLTGDENLEEWYRLQNVLSERITKRGSR